VRGEYDIPTPNSGARCIAALSDGRLFFTHYDAGLIGYVVVGLTGLYRSTPRSGDPAQITASHQDIWILAFAGMSGKGEKP